MAEKKFDPFLRVQNFFVFCKYLMHFFLKKYFKSIKTNVITYLFYIFTYKY